MMNVNSDIHTIERTVMIKQLQQRIIEELGVQPKIEAAHEVEARTAFLVSKLAETGAKGYVLGISGGQDSLLAGFLAQRAVEQARANGQTAEFHALLLPYGEQRDRKDALLACDTIRPDHITDFQIQPTVDAFAITFEDVMDRNLADFDKGNVKARVRMIAQYAVAREGGLLVIGTDHAAEAVTGFFTKFGDGAADILPLAGLNKRQGRQVLQYLGVPEIFTTKAPTADLLDKKPRQADEAELGITYDEIDDYLEGKEINPQVAEQIEARYLSTEHKRQPPIAFVSE